MLQITFVIILLCSSSKKNSPLERLEAYFQMTLHAKMAMSDLQRFPGNLNLIKNLKDLSSDSESVNLCEFLHCFL